jgi:hypothetical protein
VLRDRSAVFATKAAGCRKITPMTSTAPTRRFWIYVLPAIHLCLSLFAVATTHLPIFPHYSELAWEALFFMDYPLSIVMFFLLWAQRQVWADIWVILVGTAWWLLISVCIRGFIRLIRNSSRGTTPQEP